MPINKNTRIIDLKDPIDKFLALVVLHRLAEYRKLDRMSLPELVAYLGNE